MKHVFVFDEDRCCACSACMIGCMDQNDTEDVYKRQVLETIPMFLLLYGIWNDIADSCDYEKDSTFRYYGFGGILVSRLLGCLLYTSRCV